MADTDVWGLLFDDDAFTKAELLVAAAIGTDAEQKVIVAELERLTDWVWEPEDDQVRAQRIVYTMAALVMLSRFSIEQLAALIESSKVAVETGDEDAEADPNAVRATSVHLLEMTAQNLRDQLG